MTESKLARQRVHKAIAEGELVRPIICELCDRDVTKATTEIWHVGMRHKQLVAHHWCGYDNPLDIWWICRSCNRKLVGRHDGSLTKEEAQWWIKSNGGFTNEEDYKNYCKRCRVAQLPAQRILVQRRREALLRAEERLAELENSVL